MNEGCCEVCGRPGRIYHRTLSKWSPTKLLCRWHADQWHRNGEMKPLRRDRPVKVCAHPGCEKSVDAKGYCQRHYYRWRYNAFHEVRERHIEYQKTYRERKAGGEATNQLPRCFDCDAPVRPGRNRRHLEIGGDLEVFCADCAGVRSGDVPLAVAAFQVDESTIAVRISEAVRSFSPGLREEVEQQLWVEVLSGACSLEGIKEKASRLKRQAFVAASDRHYSVMSLSDYLNGVDGPTLEYFLGLPPA